MFKSMRTSDLQQDGPSKTLLYAHHGFGKTYQCRFYAKRFGRGLILSGESGLKSLEDVDLEYVPFSSWDGKHSPEAGVFSFRGICAMIATPEFQAEGFNWIAIDSLTEVSELLIAHLEREIAMKGDEAAKNKFALWQDYSRLMIGSLKWIRDLPLHVFVTCLAKEESDANDKTHFWPLVKGQAVAKQIPALFDHVFCGVRVTDRGSDGRPRVRRMFATDEIDGYHAKVRDPLRQLNVLEETPDVTELLARISGKPSPGASEATK